MKNLKKIFLHLPQAKTGSSYLQKIFYTNKLFLKSEHNLDYNHSLNTKFIKNFNNLNGNGFFLKSLITENFDKDKIKQIFNKNEIYNSNKSNLLFSTEHIKINNINLTSIKNLKEIFYELGFETYLILTFRSPIKYIKSAWKQQFNNLPNNLNPIKDLNFFFQEYKNYYDFEKLNSLRSIFKKNINIINYDKSKNKILQNLFEIFQIKINEEDLIFFNDTVNSSFSDTEALIAEKLSMLRIDKIKKHIRLLKSSNFSSYEELEITNNIDTNNLENLVNNINKYLDSSNKFDYEKIIKVLNKKNKYKKIPAHLTKLIGLFKREDLSENDFINLCESSENTMDLVILLILSLSKFPSNKNILVKKLIDLNFENEDFNYFIYKYYKSKKNPEYMVYLTKIYNSGDNINISKI